MPFTYTVTEARRTRAIFGTVLGNALLECGYALVKTHMPPKEDCLQVPGESWLDYRMRTQWYYDVRNKDGVLFPHLSIGAVETLAYAPTSIELVPDKCSPDDQP